MNAYEIHLDRGEVGTAVTMMREAIEMGERAGFLAAQATSRATLAETYAYLGDPDLARDTAAIALEIANERLPMARPWVLGGIAQIHLSAGELDRADAALAGSEVELLPEPLRSAASIKVPLVRGSLADARGDHGQAIEIADAVLDRLRSAGLRPFVAEAMLLKGRALAAAGRAREAGEDAPGGALDRRRPRAPSDPVGDPRGARHDRRRGGAPGLLTEARVVVRSIADGIEEELRRSFLARPDVRPLMEGAAATDGP